MKRFRLLQWSGTLLSPRTRPCTCVRSISPASSRFQSTATAALLEESDDTTPASPPPRALHAYPSPPPSRASKSAKLAALHARLALPRRLPVETLARCLIDATADPNPSFNNVSLALLGNDLLGYYTSEEILCRYPRLPMTLIFATMSAYCGPRTLALITREWGVDVAAEPGGEVDPGLLQFKRVIPGNADLNATGVMQKETYVKMKDKVWNRGLTSKTVADNYFGEGTPRSPLDHAERPELKEQDAVAAADRGVTLEQACTRFVRAVLGAIYLHEGRDAAKAFFKAHFLSRHLDIGKMFDFRQPTRDLSRLCAREGFESPVARMLSETGRMSRTPVFVVGVFSGKDKLGEGAGASLDEARIRASVAALKGWYLYSPMEVRVPSEVEGGDGGRQWEPVLIDGGEIIV